MGLRKMPDGQYVNVPDNASRDVIKRIEAQYPAKKATTGSEALRTRKGNKESRVQRRAREAADRYGDSYGWQNKLVSDMTFNLDDEFAGGVNALTRGIGRAVSGEGLQGIKDAYKEGRDTQRIREQRYDEANPVTSTAASITGAVLNPVQKGAGAMRLAAKALGGTGKIANAASKAATKLDDLGPIASGIVAGANQGALSSIGASESIDEIPNDAVYGALSGAAFGGGLGAAGQMGARVRQILKDRKPENAKSMALKEVADILGKGGYTPERAASTIRRANSTGNDMMLMDLTPSATSTAGKLSRNTDLPAANDMIKRAGERFDERGARVAEKAQDSAMLPHNGDALSLDEALKAHRSGRSSKLYEDGGAMDNTLSFSDDMQKFFDESPVANGLMQRAYRTAKMHGQEIAQGAQGNQIIPSMRAFDYLKREYDGVIGKALRSGDKTRASAYSNELNRIKGMVADANPEWQPILAEMRDMFQKEAAIEAGQKAWQGITRSPRKALKEVQGLQGEMRDNARIGIIDTFLERATTSADPMNVIRGATRNSDQRKLLEFAFGDQRRLNRFTRWVGREYKSTDADKVNKFAGQSITSRIDGARAGDGETLMREGAAGGAFGGVFGVAANVARGIGKLKPTGTPEAQEQIARLLMSDGKDFATEVKAVTDYLKAREAANKRRAIWLAKGAQAPFSSEIGGE